MKIEPVSEQPNNEQFRVTELVVQDLAWFEPLLKRMGINVAAFDCYPGGGVRYLLRIEDREVRKNFLYLQEKTDL